VEFYELANDHRYPKQFVDAVDYVNRRKIDMTKYEFYWTPEVEHKLNYRVIIPFKWKNETVGYSARTFVDGIKPKYHTEHEPNYVFNMNNQRNDSQFVIVVEGAFDAMAVDGVAVLSNECNETQADIIDSLGREVIVVPDFDRHTNKQGRTVWPGARLVDQAMEYGWSVSFPVWRETCKDVNDAVIKYGRLFTLKTILDAKETNRLKIELMKRKVASV
jgi:DNA primase